MDRTILIIEDEQKINDILAFSLGKDGYKTLSAFDGVKGLEMALKENPDLILLDVMLPGMDGFEVCRKVREKSQVPIIMLTAREDEVNKVLGLELGADDYITKPFNPLEVVARIKTQLRRYRKYNSGEQPTAQEYDIRGLTINRESHRCVLYGNELQLTPIEFSILWYLCERKGKVVPSEELFEAVWKEKYMNSNNTVMAHIARLREKMHEPARSPKFIKTVWGVGYTIE